MPGDRKSKKQKTGSRAQRDPVRMFSGNDRLERDTCSEDRDVGAGALVQHDHVHAHLGEDREGVEVDVGTNTAVE